MKVTGISIGDENIQIARLEEILQPARENVAVTPHTTIATSHAQLSRFKIKEAQHKTHTQQMTKI